MRISYNTNRIETFISSYVGDFVLYEYLAERYRPGEPIICSDIKTELSDATLRWTLKKLTDTGKLIRLDTGIYCIPKIGRLGQLLLPMPEEVADAKYIRRNNKVSGYFSGLLFANQLGLTTQLPNELEIVTNIAVNPVRRISLCGRDMIVRKPTAEITEANSSVLRLLDILRDYDKYSELSVCEAEKKVSAYITEKEIRQSDFDKYLSAYPDKTFRTVYEMRLYNVLA